MLQPIFIDFEACSMTGWPNEVGWAEVVDGRVVSEGHLIRPEPDWDEGEWDEIAESIHGISLDQLHCEGQPAVVIARRLVRVLTGRSIVSDATNYDTAFLKRLLDVDDERHDFRLVDLVALITSMNLSSRRRERLKAALDALPNSQHRAEADAAKLAYAWRAATM